MQWFITVNWPGGLYASPSFAGSRPGGVIAVTWAAMIAMGKEGYLKRAQQIYKCAQRIKEGVSSIAGLYVYGNPPAMVVSWGSDEVNIFAVNDKMAHLGWSLNPLHRPAGMHICVTNRTVGREEDLLRDLEKCVREVRADPDSGKKGNAPIYGMAQSFPDRGTVADLTMGYLDVLLELAPEEPNAAE
jgi:sphinganine-1-phosphate aldolase